MLESGLCPLGLLMTAQGQKKRGLSLPDLTHRAIEQEPRSRLPPVLVQGGMVPAETRIDLDGPVHPFPDDSVRVRRAPHAVARLAELVLDRHDDRAASRNWPRSTRSRGVGGSRNAAPYAPCA